MKDSRVQPEITKAASQAVVIGNTSQPPPPPVSSSRVTMPLVLNSKGKERAGNVNPCKEFGLMETLK